MAGTLAGTLSATVEGQPLTFRLRCGAAKTHRALGRGGVVHTALGRRSI